MEHHRHAGSPEPSPLGVYVHFPWCRRRCSYCDFPIAVARDGVARDGVARDGVARDGVAPGGAIPHDRYLAAIAAELAARADAFAGRRLVSIYFGGGTPSLWRPDCLARVVDDVCARLGHPRARVHELEVTLEANPADCTPRTLAAWRDAGINRLSIGVQSFAPQALVTLGRDHRMGDGRAALLRALDSPGLRSVSADIILGVPGGATVAGAGDDGAASPDAAAAADLGVPHLSVYELTIEPQTPLGRAARSGAFAPLADDALADAYVATHHALVARGYEHYEISSYALPGHRAVHNSLYWSGGEYLGLGNGAASFRLLPDGGAVRSTNTRAASRYLIEIEREARNPERVRLTPDEVAADALWLGMRTSDGVPAARLPGPAADWLVSQALADRTDERIIPTLRGFLYADQVAGRLFVGARGSP